MRHLAKKLSDESGSIAIITAISLAVLLGITGAGIDMARVASTISRGQGALDAAALAAVREPDDENATRRFAAYLKSAEIDPSRASIEFHKTANEARAQARLDDELDTTFAKVIGISKVPYSLRSVAAAPLRINEVEITVRSVYGWYPKSVRFRVRRPDGSTETVVNIEYTPTDIHALGGRGIGRTSVTPSSRVTVPDYDDFWLEMMATDDHGNVQSFSTDDPSTAHHLFVDGVQLQQGVKAPIGKTMPCGKTVQHAWEDGGHFSLQDVFFDVRVTCDTPDRTTARLVE